jgi:hypothetical protein
MRHIIPITLILALTGCSNNHAPENHANNHVAEKKLDVMPNADKSATASQTQPWKPVPFNSHEEKLSSNNTGKFFHKYMNLTENLYKGEYETTKEYEKRIADTNKAIEPFSTEVQYAFVPRYATMQYNADEQQYVSIYSGMSCSKRYPFNDGIGCQVDSLTKNASNYIGQNSFGATTQVDVEDGEDFYFVFPVHEFTARKFRDKILGYHIPTACPVPIEKAEKYKGKHIKFAFVISLYSAKKLLGDMRTEEPTVSSPHKKLFYSIGIPAKLVSSLCFVEETKEILHVNKLN